MTNEPITFDPAFKDIAREVSRLVSRIRVALGTDGRSAAHTTGH